MEIDFIPNTDVLSEMTAIESVMSEIFAEAPDDSQAERAILGYLAASGMACEPSSLGPFESLGARADRVIEIITQTHGALKTSHIDEAGVGQLASIYEHQQKRAPGPLVFGDAQDMLGYAVHHAHVDCQRQADTTFDDTALGFIHGPVLLYGLRGVIQLSGMAMQRVAAQHAESVDAFGARQTQVVDASNLAIMALSCRINAL
jgi:hypothetical protein